MSEEAFGQLLYCSQAVRPLSRDELYALLLQSRERNARESITGLLVYHEGHFWQWLEGPADALARVWARIAHDPRHHRLQRLPTPWRSTRLFPDWRMQVAVAGTAPTHDGLSLDERTVRQLRHRGARVASIVEGIGLDAAMPDAATIARLLARGALQEVDAALARVVRARPSLEALWHRLVRPVAAALGDAWMTDELSQTDLAIAHVHLLRLVHTAHVGESPDAQSAARGTALVAPLPGECDFAGAAFASIALTAQAWHVVCPFPADRAALEAELSAHRFDLLHLSISDIFPREQRLAEMAAAIRAARRVSANPLLQVLVSGRAFADQPGLSTLVGADGAGLWQGSTPADLEAARHWSRVRPHSVAAMVAQATFDDVVLNVQRKRFGIPEEQAAGWPASDGRC